MLGGLPAALAARIVGLAAAENALVLARLALVSRSFRRAVVEELGGRQSLFLHFHFHFHDEEEYTALSDFNQAGWLLAHASRLASLQCYQLVLEISRKYYTPDHWPWRLPESLEELRLTHCKLSDRGGELAGFTNGPSSLKALRIFHSEVESALLFGQPLRNSSLGSPGPLELELYRCTPCDRFDRKAPVDLAPVWERLVRVRMEDCTDINAGEDEDCTMFHLSQHLVNLEEATFSSSALPDAALEDLSEHARKLRRLTITFEPHRYDMWIITHCSDEAITAFRRARPDVTVVEVH